MQITILSASKSQHTSKAGKPYYQLEVAYKGEDGQVKGKKLMPFGTTKASFDALSSAQPGELWSIVSEKEGDFWVWTSAKKSDGSAPVVATPTSVTQTTPAGKVVGSNYETKEERAAKQVYIVRQSSISAAVALKPKASVEEVISTAKEFEAFVFGKEATISPAVQDLLDMDTDVPL